MGANAQNILPSLKIECTPNEKNPGHAFGDKTSIKAQAPKNITFKSNTKQFSLKEKYRYCFKPF